MLQKIAIKMLGDFSVVADGRCVVDATAKLTKPWQLFCYLALNREHVTPSSVLLQELWGGEELADPANVLKNTVYALRRELAIKGLRREAKLRLIETALAAPGTPDSR